MAARRSRAAAAMLPALLACVALLLASAPPAVAADPGGLVDVPPDREMVNLWQFADRAVRGPNPNPNTWDWTAAIQAAIDYCESQASVVETDPASGTTRGTGLPTLYVPRGIYRNTATHLIEYVQGFTIRGDGIRGSVFQHEGANVMFDVHGSHGLNFDAFSVQGRDPRGTGGYPTGLVENSGAFRFRDDAADPWPAERDALNTRVSVEVNEMHRAFRFEGDIMTDSFVLDRYRARDNFVDFDYANSNALNHQMFGGEVIYAADAPKARYQARLDLWRDRPDVEDGAVFNISAGGQVTWFGGSVIADKPTLYLHPTRTDGTQGAPVNPNPVNFYGVRWEMRWQDTEHDVFGLERATMIRYENPYPTSARIVPSIRFTSCDWLIFGAQLDLFALANYMTVSVGNSRVQYSQRASVRLVSLLNAMTPNGRGVFRSTGTQSLDLVKKAAPGYRPTTTVDQTISQEGT